MKILRLIVLFLLAAGALGVVFLPRPEREMAVYATSLDGRTGSQRANALLAARALDGTVIQPGHVFSFNRTVGPWTAGRGYMRAPVSYEGELVKDWGGGVCQTSSTLYNAALLAGLQIVERHRHTWAPAYVPPGRDAAVAQMDVDLRLRNPYSRPVRISTWIAGESIGFRIYGPEKGPVASLEGVITGRVDPMEIVQSGAFVPRGQRRVITRGKPGARVAVYRTFLHGPRSGKREMVSRDSYPAMNRVVAVSPAP